MLVESTWGETRLSNGYVLKDAIVSTSGFSSNWDWSDFNLHHIPGYSDYVVERILRYVCEKQLIVDDGVVICSLGMHSRIQKPNKKWNKGMLFVPSKEAVKVYNEYAEGGTSAACLFLHSTC